MFPARKKKKYACSLRKVPHSASGVNGAAYSSRRDTPSSLPSSGRTKQRCVLPSTSAGHPGPFSMLDSMIFQWCGILCHRVE